MAATRSLDEVAAEVTELLVAARAAVNAERVAAKKAVVLLARKMAEKIVGHAVEVDASVLADIVAQALSAAGAQKASAVLRVHPEDLSALQATRGKWLSGLGAKADVRLVADPAVGKHGCVVETAVGRLDARLQTQLDALERALHGIGLGHA